MMSYQNPPIMDEDETVDPVVVTTITSSTTTTSIHRSKWIMVAVVAGMMMLVAAGAVMMQDRSYYHSSRSIENEDSGIMTAIEGLVVGTQGKKTAMTTPTTTTTTTPTLQTVIAQYLELIDYSPEEQNFQYQAYLLYLNGITLEELNAYYNINGSQQDGGGGATGLFSCCKDEETSTDCYEKDSSYYGSPYGGGRTCRSVLKPIKPVNPTAKRRSQHRSQHRSKRTDYIPEKCRYVGIGTHSVCCCSTLDSRIGSRIWFWGHCN